MELQRQAGLATSPLPRFPYLQMAKVIGIRRDTGMLDVMLMEHGVILTGVPILSNQIASTAGMFDLIAPTTNRNVLAGKTYLAPEIDLIRPGANTESDRDLYVVVAHLEGSQRGASGYVALGFADSIPSEMHINSTDYPDLWLHRHPSDFQTTIDQWGRLSLQHPCSGARIILDNQKPSSGADTGDEVTAAWPDILNLASKDLDKHYELRSNILNAFIATRRRPQILLRIPRLMTGRTTRLSSGAVTDGRVDNSRFFVPTPACFATNLGSPPIPEGHGQEARSRVFILGIDGERHRIVRTGRAPNNDVVIVISPPLKSAPAVGTTFEVWKGDEQFKEGGEVFHWLTHAGDALLTALWYEQQGNRPRGKIIDLSGELHRETVKQGNIEEIAEQGDILETAHQGQEGGNIKENADLNIEETAGQDIKEQAGQNINMQAGQGTTETAGTSIIKTAGTIITISATGVITIQSAAAIILNSATLIALNAPSVLVNGIYDEAQEGDVGRLSVG